jgi:hypothetical protein
MRFYPWPRRPPPFVILRSQSNEESSPAFPTGKVPPQRQKRRKSKVRRQSLPSLGGRCRPQAAKEGLAVNSDRSYSLDKTGVPSSGGATFLLVQKDGEERARQGEGLFTKPPLSLDSLSPKIATDARLARIARGPSLCSGRVIAVHAGMSRPDDRPPRTGDPYLPHGEGAAAAAEEAEAESSQAIPTFPWGKVPPAGGERGTSCKFGPQLFV